jgi:hypothetical protein
VNPSSITVLSQSISPDQIQLQDSRKFCTDIEVLVANHRMGYMDAIVHLCESKSMEPEMAATLINPVIRERIRNEATGLNMIRKTATLPF